MRKQLKKKRQLSPKPADLNFLARKVCDLEMQLEDVQRKSRSGWDVVNFLQKCFVVVLILIGCVIVGEIVRLMFLSYLHYITVGYNTFGKGEYRNFVSDGFNIYGKGVEVVSTPGSLRFAEAQPPTSFPRVKKTPQINLLSLSRPATADIIGGLGPPDVVTQESTLNWLGDRWQGIALKISRRIIFCRLRQHFFLRILLKSIG